jgi:hypothetical protein
MFAVSDVQDVVGTPFVIMAAKHAVSDAFSVAVVEARDDGFLVRVAYVEVGSAVCRLGIPCPCKAWHRSSETSAPVN